MWLMSEHGFVSIVESREDDAMLLVRARDRSHLMRLKRQYGALDPFTILDTPERDYPCRLIVPRDVMCGVIAAMVDEIAYGNFKSHVEVEHGRGSLYLSFLHRVWVLGCALTRREVAAIPRRVNTGVPGGRKPQ